MSLILSGTDGLSDIDGSAATPAIRGTDANTGIFFPAADTIAFSEGGVEAMRINSSGNVGIGTTSPGRRLDVSAATGLVGVTSSTGTNYAAYQALNTGGTMTLGLESSTGGTIFVNSSAYSAIFGTGGAYSLHLATNNTVRQTIDSSGKVGINVTPVAGTDAKLQVTGGTTNATTLATAYSTATVAIVPKSTSGYSLAIASGTSDLPQLQVSANGTATGDLLVQPYGGNLLVGTSTAISGNTQITIVGQSTNRGALQMGRTTAATTGVAGSLVAYNGSNAVCGMDFQSNGANNSGYIGTYTYNAGAFAAGPYLNTGGTNWTASSDERLKNVTGEITDALNKVSQIRAVEFTWKADSLNKQNVGFIAQEVQAVLPEVVDTDTNGHLGVRYAEVTSLLVAAIKEQQALITALTTRITALETP